MVVQAREVVLQLISQSATIVAVPDRVKDEDIEQPILLDTPANPTRYCVGCSSFATTQS